MRKAQINSQFLVYILAVIITAMILIYGYKAINDIRENAKTVERITFMSEIRTAVKSISPDYGTVKSRSFRVPSGYTEVCFVNLEYKENEAYAIISILPPKYQIMKEMVKAINAGDPVVPKNLYLCPNCADQEYVGNITLIENEEEVAYICFPVQSGSIRLRLEGAGYMTIIS